MKYEKADSDGSFSALGIAFAYQYNAPLKVLGILNTANGRLVYSVDLDRALAAEPRTYLNLLERTSQIESLKYTNNVTLNLAEKLDDKKLASILRNICLLARLAFDLEQENFQHFEALFCRHYDLSGLQFRKYMGLDGEIGLYTAHLETRHKNTVSAQGETLPGLLRTLSQKVTQDLITKELSLNYENNFGGFMRAAATLSSLNQILNINFCPVGKLSHAHMPLKHQA